MSWSLRKTAISSFLCQLLAILCIAALVNGLGCVSRTKKQPPPGAPPTVIPAAPVSAGVIQGHRDRETVQFDAAERINVSVTGLPVEAEVRGQTTVIVDANKVASADQIARMAAAFEVTITAQATEIKRLGAENTRLAADNTALAESNAALQNRLDDFGRKVAVYTANGIGALLLLIAVGVGILTKNLQYVGWCMLGSVCGFGAARLIGHWLFPWIIGGSITLVVVGLVVAYLFDQRRKAEKERLAKASDDLIQGVEEVRGLFKSPPAEMAEIVRNADTPEKAIDAVKRLGVFVNKTLSEWVTDHDGTHDVIKSRRRQLGLI